MTTSTTARGKSAEDRAARALVARGYTVLERNVRAGGAELDLVCEHRDFIVFVEVRSRADDRFGTPSTTVGFHKQRRVARGALAWLVAHRCVDARCRFDVVSVLGDDGDDGDDARIEIIENAFEAPA